jgi:hypothetical protein
MLGGFISEAGLEGFGDSLATIGQFATIAGTALTALGPVISFLGKNV